MASPCARTRAATTTSKPASRAARAAGSRCEQKYQSSVTRKSSFGRDAADREDTGSGGSNRLAAAGVEKARVLSAHRVLFNASPAQSPAQSEDRLARILVTGAGGFIGRALCPALVRHGHVVYGLTRRPAQPIAGVELSAIGDIAPRTDWSGHLGGIDVVVHLANRAHRRAGHGEPHDEAEAAAALARAAARCGVQRLVHMSSIRAMGDATPPGSPFRAGDRPRPRDPYGRAKLAIEPALAAAANAAGLELVMLRPPLVYGPGVKGNLHALIRLVASGVPLPFARIDNRRSLIALDNLVALTALASFHPAAAGQVLL
ncbi:MAG: NAD-dependent epimerase/dehydratase family protein, partial [Stellaceae bacterium]